MPKAKTLVLLDVHAILHRAYHALPDFSTSSGQPTGGLYGLTSMLIKLVNELKPDFLIACYDLPEPTFRKVAYEAYKAGRKPTDSELVGQIEHSREIFGVLGIPVYEKAGFEADDVIGTIVEETKKEKNLKTIIASGDLDTLQLVEGKRVQVYTFKKGLNDTILYDESAVRERFGFAPELLPDWKGLRGDPSDNIIGIAGIGEKTATTLISCLGPIEKIYQTVKHQPAKILATGLKERVLKLLAAGEEEALFSKTLATIRRDAPIKFRLPIKGWREVADRAAVEALLDAWEFRTLKERLLKLLAGDNPTTQTLFKEKIVTSQSSEEQVALHLLNLPSGSLGVDFEAKLKAENLWQIYREIELPLIGILVAASERGIKLDRQALSHMAGTVKQELQRLATKVYRAAGREFNLNSPVQLGEVLFDELKISTKGLKKTAGGARSTRESELQKLASAHPIIEDILAYRERQKLLSTYIEALPKLTDKTGTLHTTFDQFGAATGRLSSRDPNLQNIPAGSGLGSEVRRAFVARPGHQFLSLDYAQIEMRVLAVLSGDEALLDSFKRNFDIHSAVAARVFGVKENEVTKEMRRQAKVINFGIVYGMGVNALRTNLGTTREAAAEFYRRYFETFPGLQKYFEQVKSEARARGYTLTHFGRRRYLPYLNSKEPRVRAEAERQATNAPVQGTAADIIKLAMVRAEALLREKNLRSQTHLLLTVHDELLYEVEEKFIKQAIPILEQAMTGVVAWPIPLTVKIATGPNWAELE